jgi:hypothetical protein
LRPYIIGIDIVEINPMNDIGAEGSAIRRAASYSMAARTSSWILFDFLGAIRQSRR